MERKNEREIARKGGEDRRKKNEVKRERGKEGKGQTGGKRAGKGGK